MRPEEQFHDYTLASNLERFVAAIEQTLVSWQRTGLAEIIHRGYRARIKEQPSQVKVLASLQHRLPWRREPYILQLHLPTALALGGNGVAYCSGHVSSTHSQQQQQQQQQQPPPAATAAALAAGLTATTSTSSATTLSSPATATAATSIAAPQRTPNLQMSDLMAGGQVPDGDGDGGSGATPGTSSSNGAGAEGPPAIHPTALPVASTLPSDGRCASHDLQPRPATLLGDLALQPGHLEEASQSACVTRRAPDEAAASGEQSPADKASVARREGGGHSGTADAEAGGDGASSAAGGTASEVDPGWEVGVDLDMTELLTRIDTIVNDSEAQDPAALELERDADTGGSGDSDSRLDLAVHQVQLGHNGGGGDGEMQRMEVQIGTDSERQGRVIPQMQHVQGERPPQLQSMVCSIAVSAEGSVRDGLPTRGSPSPVSTAVGAGIAPPPPGFEAATTASAKLAAAWPSARPTGLPWWLPTFQHRLQRWFGLDAFLLMHPASYSRRILDETEAASLLGAAALALSAAGLRYPLLLPVHDGLRDGYWGVAVVPDVGCLHLRTDSVHISSPPTALTRLPAQLQALAEQLTPFSPTAAVACLQAATWVEEKGSGAGEPVSTAPFARPPLAPAADNEGSSGAPPDTTGGGESKEAGGGSAARITWSACFTFPVPRPTSRLAVQIKRWAARQAEAEAEAEDTRGTNAATSNVAAAHTVDRIPNPSLSHSPGAERSHRLADDDQTRKQRVAAALAVSGGDRRRSGGIGLYDNTFLDGGTDGGRYNSGGAVRVEDDEQDGDEYGLGVFSDTDPWDARAPWHPWAVQSDPVADLELDVAWEDLRVYEQQQPRPQTCHPAPGLGPHRRHLHEHHQLQGEDARGAPQLQAGSAQRWLLHALQVGTGRGGGGGMWGLRMGGKRREAQRRHVELQRAGADWLWTAMAAESWRRPGEQPPPTITPVSLASQVGPGSFTVMLSSLLTGRSLAREAAEVGQLLDPDWWEGRGWPLPPLPPQHVMQDVLQDMFDHDALRPSGHEDAGGDGGGEPYPRTAPLQGLLSRLALHSLVFGNARAVAWLWQRFVRELRFSCWEVDRQLPRMAASVPSTATQTIQPPQPATSPSIQRAARDARAASGKPHTRSEDVAAAAAGVLQRHAPQGLRSHRRGTSTEPRRGGVEDGGYESDNDEVNQAKAGDRGSDGKGGDGAVSSSSSDVEGSVSSVLHLERLLLRQREEQQPPPGPLLRHCLLHQKLQVLDVCIHRRRMMTKQQHLVQHMEQQQRQQPQQRYSQQHHHHPQQQRRGSKHLGLGPSIARHAADNWGWGEAAGGQTVAEEEREEDDGWWSELSTGWETPRGHIQGASVATTSAQQEVTPARNGGSDGAPAAAIAGLTAACGRGSRKINDVTIRSRTRKMSRSHCAGPPSPTRHAAAEEIPVAPTATTAAAARTLRIDDSPSRDRGLDVGAVASIDGYGDGGGSRVVEGVVFSPRSPSLPSGLVPTLSTTDTEAYYSAGDEQDVSPPPQSPACSSCVAVRQRSVEEEEEEEAGCERPVSSPAAWAPPLSSLRRRQVRPPALTSLDLILSEDRMLERQAALEGLAEHPRGGELAWRMNSDRLASDMAAFKAANPGGCSFSDFIAWYSPRDVVTGLKPKNAAGGHARAKAKEEGEQAAAAAVEAEVVNRQSDPSAVIGDVDGKCDGGRGKGSDGDDVFLSARMGAEAVTFGSFGAAGAAAIPGGNCAAVGSGVVTHGSPNPWRRLWDRTAACPVWKQKPLQDPGLEGERVLHELETLSPAHLYDTLLAMALAVAVQLLAASDGCRLPPVASLLQQYIRISAPIVKRGCSLAAASTIAAGTTQPAGHSQQRGSTGQPSSSSPPLPPPSPGSTHELLGWEDAELEYLLAEFHYLEQAVVLGESLVRRLPGNRSLAADMLTTALHGSPFLEEGRSVRRPVAWVDGTAARQALAALLAQRCPSRRAGEEYSTLPRRHRRTGADEGPQSQPQNQDGERSFGGGGRGAGRVAERLGSEGGREVWEKSGWDEWEGEERCSAQATAAGNPVAESCGRRNAVCDGSYVTSGSDSIRCGSGGGGRGNVNVVLSSELWPSPCSREWLLRVEQPLGPGAKLQQQQQQQGRAAAGPPSSAPPLLVSTSNAPPLEVANLRHTSHNATAVSSRAAASSGCGMQAAKCPRSSSGKGRQTSGGGAGGGERRLLGAQRLSAGGGEKAESRSGVPSTARSSAPAAPVAPTPAVVARTDSVVPPGSCTHRLYVLAAEGEMRVATAIWHTL